MRAISRAVPRLIPGHISFIGLADFLFNYLLIVGKLTVIPLAVAFSVII